MSKPRDPLYRKLKEEQAKRLSERPTPDKLDRTLIDRFDGFPWDEIAKVRDKVKSGRNDN